MTRGQLFVFVDASIVENKEETKGGDDYFVYLTPCISGR